MSRRPSLSPRAPSPHPDAQGARPAPAGREDDRTGPTLVQDASDGYWERMRSLARMVGPVISVDVPQPAQQRR